MTIVGWVRTPGAFTFPQQFSALRLTWLNDGTHIKFHFMLMQHRIGSEIQFKKADASGSGYQGQFG